MPQRELITRKYLSPTANTFWLWADHARVITLRDGTTLAFREEVLQVLNALETVGLPPLNNVVLLIAATRQNWLMIRNQLFADWPAIMTEDVGDLLERLHAELSRVSALVKAVPDRTQLLSKLALVVFDPIRHRTTPAVAADILAGWPTLPAEYFSTQSTVFTSWTQFYREMEDLCTGLRRVTADVLELRHRTGLEQEVVPAEIEEEEGEIWQRARQRMDEWASDAELCGLARLARDLLAAVHLPRPLADRDELPLGGVSDITNRGSLDRLLLSELAYDDLSLSVRIALNEALYLRRENPPRTPPRERTLLIDAGLRMWGVPRVFAAAVALSLSATTDAHARMTAYRAASGQLVPLDLTTRKGMLDHLAALQPELHLGAALEEFCALPQEAAGDAVLITSEETLADPTFRTALAAAETRPLFLATVSRAGRFQLWLRSARGMNLIREATVRLEDILSPTPVPRKPLLDPNRDPQLPAIFGVQPFPLRLSHPIDPTAVWKSTLGQTWAISHDGRLMCWDRLDAGGRQIFEPLPTSKVFWLGRPHSGDTMTAIMGRFSREGLRLLTIDHVQETCRVESLAAEPSGDQQKAPLRAVTAFQGVASLIFAKHVEQYDILTGRFLGKLSLPAGAHWAKGRFFRSGMIWLTLAFDGIDPRLDEIPFKVPGNQIVRDVFDCDIFNEPVALTNRGDFVRTTEDVRPLISIQGLPANIISWTLAAASRHGSQIVVSNTDTYGPHARKSYLVDVNTAKVLREVTAHESPGDVVETLNLNHYQPLNLRNKFQAVGINGFGQLGLLDRNQQVMRLEIDGRGMPVWHKGRPKGTEWQLVPFGVSPVADRFGYVLRRADWADGSTTFLDTRGLLHLRSSDPKIPELTIVLHEGETTIWCSEGWTIGKEYFRYSPNASQANPEQVRAVLHAFLPLGRI